MKIVDLVKIAMICLILLIIMSKEWDTLSRIEKKKVAKETLKMLERKKKFKAWLNKIFNSNIL